MFGCFMFVNVGVLGSVASGLLFVIVSICNLLVFVSWEIWFVRFVVWCCKTVVM